MPTLVEPDRYLEILKPDRCSICFLVQDYVQGHLKSVLDECATDPLTRESLFKSKGFCRLHAWQAVGMRKSLALGLIYESLLKKGMDDLPKLSRFWAKAKPCLVCESEKKCDETYSRQFALSWAHSEKMRTEFEDHGILCQPHLEKALSARIGSSFRGSLRDAGKKALERVLKDLNEFLAKQDYHRSAEPLGGEWDAWVKAVRLISGERV